MSEKSTVIVVGGKSFELDKKGLAQAELVVSFSKWLGRHGAPAIEVIAQRDDAENMGQLEMLFAVADQLTADALIELFMVVLNCNKKFAEEHFDIGVLVEAGGIVWETQPSIRRLISRFFSTRSSGVSSADNSTISEPPTDGPTTK